jgi:Dehydrogenases with different specificities (related to short-chain alcohol dehydrogenases)
MNTDLAGKVVLITGASGGIGSAMARKFADEGSKLALHYRRGRSQIDALSRELNHSDCLTIQADLSNEPQVKRLFTKTLRHFGRIDTLIANAGSWVTEDVLIHQMSLRQWEQTLAGVLTTTFLTVREFFRIVAKQKQGNAVLISSTAAVFGEAGHADYSAGKAAIAYGLTRSLKNEIARIAPHAQNYCGGRVNCICPGWTVVSRNKAKLRDAAMIKKVTATMALPQIARPDDIAHTAVFLSSDTLARHITGQTLVIAGGMEGRWLWQSNEIDPSLA